MQVHLLLGLKTADRLQLRRRELQNIGRRGRKVRIRQEQLRGKHLQQRKRLPRVRHVADRLRRHDQRSIPLPPRLRSLHERVEDDFVLQVHPRLVDHHQLHAIDLRVVVNDQT